jgi:hypothetical protein
MRIWLRATPLRPCFVRGNLLPAALKPAVHKGCTPIGRRYNTRLRAAASQPPVFLGPLEYRHDP